MIHAGLAMIVNRVAPVLAVSVIPFASPAVAQQSASFKLTEHVFNSGGHPKDGVVSQSASFRVTLDAIGEAVVRSGMSSASFRMEASFGLAYPPPGEVAGTCGIAAGPCLRFTNGQTLTWPAERSAGVYDLYRDTTRAGFGSCEQRSLGATTATDPAIPPAASGFFYLVTVKNRLGEEGTKGFRSGGIERLGAFELAVCP